MLRLVSEYFHHTHRIVFCVVMLFFMLDGFHRFRPDALVTAGVALRNVITILVIDKNLVFQTALGALGPRDKLFSHAASPL